MGVFAEVAVTWPVVEAFGRFTAGGPQDHLGLGFPSEDDEVLGLGHVAPGGQVVVNEDRLVQGHAVGDEDRTAILGRSGLKRREPLVVREMIVFEGGKPVGMGGQGGGQGVR